MTDSRTELSQPQKALLVASAIAVFGSLFWPTRPVLRWGLSALGNPSYEGFRGIFLPHLLLYSTVAAALSILLWQLFVWLGLLPPPRWTLNRRSAALGIATGIVSAILTLVVAFAILPQGTVRWIDPVPWKIAGNVFSNLFEEVIFRGFILAALRRAIDFWPAALVSSASWAVLHSQYPVAAQFLIFFLGVGFCWLLRRTVSLWAPYIAHMVLDVIGDSFIG